MTDECWTLDRLFLPTQMAVWCGIEQKRDRTGISRSNTPNIMPERLAEMVWLSKLQSSLLNIYPVPLKKIYHNKKHYCLGLALFAGNCVWHSLNSNSHCSVFTSVLVGSSPLSYLFTPLRSIAAQVLSDNWCSTFAIVAGQLRSVTEIAPKSPFLYVNRILIRYYFRASVKLKLSGIVWTRPGFLSPFL